MADQELSEAARALLDLCRRKRLILAAAESCTGGLLAATLTEIPGSSDVFERGFITYSNEAKRAMLGVTPMTLAKHGAVSRETAEAMATGVLAHAPLEGRGKAAEGGVEHRAHQQAQRPALELIRNEKFHLAGLLAGRMKDPAVFEPAEGALEILDQDMQTGSVERDPAGEGLADELVGNRHVGDEDLDAFRLG